MNTSCLTRESIQSIIISNKGIPLPEENCDVIDAIMEWWGRAIHPIWEQHVLQHFAELLDPKGFHANEELVGKRKELFHDCIFIHIEYKLCMSMGGYSPAMYTASEDWNYYYDWMWDYVSKDFYYLAIESIKYTDGLIAIQNNNMVPHIVVTDGLIAMRNNTMVPPIVVSSSTVTIVDETNSISLA
jgi:hypothetical protein